MRVTRSPVWLALAASLLLAGCASVTRQQPEAAAVDDDASCRAGGNAPGSDAYAKCLKDRDAARGQAQSRIDYAHRRNSEIMLNGR